MKNTFKIAIISALFLAGTAFAQVSSSGSELCSSIKELSKVIMTKRQEGVPYSSMYAIAAKNDEGGGIHKFLVTSAYIKPRVFDLDARVAIVEDFGNEQYNFCMDVLRKGK